MGNRFTDQRETGGSIAPGVYMNPGTEALDMSDEQQAEANMPNFIHDVGVPATFERTPELDYHEKYQDGRYAFVVRFDGHEIEVQMPGIPVEEVRYMRTPDQNIWDFPRLYVEGSSWVWYFAIRNAQRAFGLEVEDD